ncbi:MAG: site-specific DNA-methyltransferase, partial [Actinomycetota bacterium]|nr:site-specific DNA-methyltransferase [Actinomycetota bacterium]
DPYWSDSSVALFHRDALAALSALPPESISLTVTSPPYNIGKEYERPLSLDAYLDWSAAWIASVHRATARGGAFWLNLGYISVPERAKAMPISYLLWDRVPFYLLQEVVWNYGAGVAARTSFSPRNEKFLWYVKDAEQYTFNLDDVRDPDVKYPNQKKNGKLKCNPLGKNPTDVWTFPKVTSGSNRSSPERTPHPAQFPEAVVERIILACSNQGDVVLDPFLGSGTTAAVARRLGRCVIGFEVNERYLADVAVPRLRAAVQQLALV